jgi:hypothetical protein
MAKVIPFSVEVGRVGGVAHWDGSSEMRVLLTRHTVGSWF